MDFVYDTFLRSLQDTILFHCNAGFYNRKIVVVKSSIHTFNNDNVQTF